MKKIMITYNIPTKHASEKISAYLIKSKISHRVTLSKNMQSLYIHKNCICKENEYKVNIVSEDMHRNKIMFIIKHLHPFKYLNIKTKYTK